MSIYNNDPLNERGSASRIGPQIVNEDGEINIPKFITNEQNCVRKCIQNKVLLDEKIDAINKHHQKTSRTPLATQGTPMESE